METPDRYRVTAEPKAQGPRIWMVYEAESGAIVAKKLDEIEAQVLCDHFNGGNRNGLARLTP